MCSVAVDDLTSYYLLRQLSLTSTGEELVTLFRTLDISYARYFILLIAVGLIRRDSLIAICHARINMFRVDTCFHNFRNFETSISPMMLTF